MKCHTGVDAGSGLVHTVEATAANVHNITVAAKLLRKDDEVVYGDSAYLGLEKRDEIKKPQLSMIEFRLPAQTCILISLPNTGTVSVPTM